VLRKYTFSGKEKYISGKGKLKGESEIKYKLSGKVRIIFVFCENTFFRKNQNKNTFPEIQTENQN